jgi:hypothetical protein
VKAYFVMYTYPVPCPSIAWFSKKEKEEATHALGSTSLLSAADPPHRPTKTLARRTAAAAAKS